MSEEKKDTKLIKDPIPEQVRYGAGISSPVSLNLFSYSRTNKLVTALYMVTDIMDKEEPLRLKLRTLGVEILSDMHFPASQTGSASKLNLDTKIQEVLSFLDIASTIGMISEMNCSILKKEFIELKQSIQESRQGSTLSLSEFFTEIEKDDPIARTVLATGNSKGHVKHNIGIQKGNTLLKALNKKVSNKNSFSILKQQRRDEIIKIVKTFNSGATITDIRTSATGLLASCGEKTLQRELVSMVKDGVLNRTGSKRWSKYSLRT